MGLYRASFRLRHECPYRELSEQYPNLTIREWYLSDCQLLEVTAQERTTDELIDDIDWLGEVLHQARDGRGLHVVLRSCLCSLEDSIIERFEKHNCLYQPPTVHRHGWEHYTLIGFDQGSIRAVQQELHNDREIEVLSMSGLDDTQVPHSLLQPADQLFEGITDRQLAAIRHALDNGYYEQPRKASVSELAETTAVARSTFEEHLRKAENKLMTNAGRLVRLIGPQEQDPLAVSRGTKSDAVTSD